MSMTDEQIVKGLENITSEKIGYCKRDCAFYDGKVHSCGQTVALHALDLIRRQQEENDHLREDTKKVRAEAAWDIATEYEAYKEAVEVALVETRAEAVREFAEFLIDKAENNVIRIGDLRDYVIDFNETTEKEGGKG